MAPDPTDNFLFDLGIQFNVPFIISDDAQLLSFKMKPVRVRGCNWFLKQFPL
jgi:predicted nucleic acid-binding protein